MALTKSELQEWNSHPVTKKIITEVKLAIVGMQEESPVRETIDLTAMGVARKEGTIDGANAWLLAYDEQIEDAVDE